MNRVPAATLELEHPITFKNGNEVSSLEIRRVKLKDLRGLPRDPVDSTLMLLSRLTGQPPSVIEEIDAEDMRKAEEIVRDFLPKSPETGDKSSDGLPTD